ncbi:hypothetical protein BT96DRAFT_956355 [Gymnopus androsaceus JB14]|uniref:Uncharacterized protein n=1 Tax=Gymnopus androsaceus JB14 TaxID=1447944 RepID=A0A6A4HZF8_9AGAR|nr:hypothetical protein BT96DRAFT_956355 [Gymnopus androsaceus JB14]
MLDLIKTTRYLNPQISATKCGQLDLLVDYAADPLLHGGFIDMARVSPFMFQAYLFLIGNYLVFFNGSNNSQAPVEGQLAEKEQEKEWIDQDLGFCALWKEGYIMYNGTTIVLYERPMRDGTSYYTRKSNYGLNSQDLASKQINMFFLSQTTNEW